MNFICSEKPAGKRSETKPDKHLQRITQPILHKKKALSLFDNASRIKSGNTQNNDYFTFLASQDSLSLSISTGFAGG